MTSIEEIQRRLFALQDLKYRDFSSKLAQTVDPEIVIGTRTPLLPRSTATLLTEEKTYYSLQR